MTGKKPYNILFIHGLPDNRQVTVMGYDKAGQVAYRWDGNTDFHSHIQGPDIAKHYLSIIWFAEPDRTLSRPDMVVNCINDPDISGNSLAKAADIVAQITAKWPDVKLFNSPKQVMATTRDQIYQRFHTLPGLKIPKTVKIKPSSVADVLALAREAGIGFPFLLRPSGSHQSESLCRVEQATDPMLETYAYDGRHYYVSEFVEYKSADGLYRKARLVALNGTLLPRHYMTGEHWMVHGDLHDQYMAHHENTRREEDEFVRKFRKKIAREAFDSLLEIARQSGLDYLGYDFAVRPDGSLLIFEINPAQNSFGAVNFSIFPYMKQVRETMVGALNGSIGKKLAA